MGYRPDATEGQGDQGRLNNDSHTIKEIGKYFCWLSGLGARTPVDNWNAEWFLQVAHIASGQGKARRVDDRRAVVLLCPLAHDCHVSDSDRFTTKTICGKDYPTIDERHTLWIKREMDPDHYDPDFLSKIWIGNLPEPQEPPAFWNEWLFDNQHIMRG